MESHEYLPWAFRFVVITTFDKAVATVTVMEESRRMFLQELVLTALLFALSVILSVSGAFDLFNWKLYDTIVAWHRRIPEHRDNVVFVCIDQKSIDTFSNELAIGWPWPREFHGRVVDYLAMSGARAIVFDVIFSEQDIDRDELTGSSSDDNFARAIESSGITYLAVAGENSGFPGKTIPADYRFFLSAEDPFSSLKDTPGYRTALFPVKRLASVSHGLGLVNMDPENDGIHRRYPIVSKLGDAYVPSLAYAVVRDILDAETIDKTIHARLGQSDYIDKKGKFILNWYGIGGPGRGSEGSDSVFRYYSYSAVLFSSLMEEAGTKPVIERDVFRDKIVVIGSNAAGLLDLKATPFTHISLYPGMEIHATAIENMLTNDFIRFTPRWILVAVMAVIAFLLFVIDRVFRSLRLFIGSFFMLALLELVAAFYFLTVLGRWIPVVDILSATMFVFAGLVISGYFHETKEKRLLKRSFGRYVNETVLNEIMSNPQAVDFRGRTIRATIMATDIEGFTGISEKLQPHEVVKRLNDYLSEVSGTLIDNDAYINKYIGDAILALFGAFGEPGHERTSCMAAVKVRDIVQRKIEEAKRDGEYPLITRFGIATGEMTMGNIGSERKLEFTVIGDTVNTAFRFEGLNKFYRTTIIVGDQTMIAAGDSFEFRQLDIIRVKGKETPEVVFELLGVRGDVPSEKIEICREFERAGELYRGRRFEEALEIYSRLAKEGDGASEVFEGRCRQFMTEPPPPDWNGVWVMLRK